MKRTEHGSMSIEVIVLTPVLVGAIMVIAAGARYVDARGQVNHAAYAAARAASLTTNQEAALDAGTQAAQRSMSGRGYACALLKVTVDAGEFVPGGRVRATVTCVADLTDLAGFGLPGSKRFTFTAVAPIEVHRSSS